MAVSKKGIFFSSIALIMSVALLLAYGTQPEIYLKEEISLTEARADAVNYQVRDIRNNYLPQSAHLAGYTAFYSISEYIRQRGRYFATEQIFRETLKEVIINGTMCCSLPASPIACTDTDFLQVTNPSLHIGVDSCIGGNIMKGKNLTRRLLDMENISFNVFRINTSFNRDFASMMVFPYQDNSTGPWQVGINITINYSVFSGGVMINHTENISTVFRIEGIPDPLYAIGSLKSPEDGNTQYVNYFNRTNISSWSVRNLYSQIESRMYEHDGNGSSFLMRFYGLDEKSPCCGVESLINPVTMTSVNGNRERPYIDWCYYGSGNRCVQSMVGAMWNVTCITKEADGTMFYRFAIDTYHAIKYNLTNEQQSYLYSQGPPPACPIIPFP